MAKVLLNRSENDIKNKWNSMKRMRLRSYSKKKMKVANDVSSESEPESDTSYKTDGESAEDATSQGYPHSGIHMTKERSSSANFASRDWSTTGFV